MMRFTTTASLVTLALLPGCYGGGGNHIWLGAPAWLVCGVLGAYIATTKGRGGCTWFVLCSVLGPIGLILAAVISKER